MMKMIREIIHQLKAGYSKTPFPDIWRNKINVSIVTLLMAL